MTTEQLTLDGLGDGKLHRILAAQDDIVIALADGKPVTAAMMAALPPWRAYLYAQMIERAGWSIDGWTAEAIKAQAMEVGGAGCLTAPASHP